MKELDIDIHRTIHLFALITGIIILVPILLLLDESYMIVGSQFFGEDLLVFIFFVALTFITLYAWFRIYLQFKKDKTKLGFEPDKSGISVIATASIEMIGLIISTIILYG